MKRTVFSLLTVVALSLLTIVVLLFFACTTKSPERGYHIGWGVIKGEESPFSIRMDYGSQLYIVENLAPGFEMEDDKRVIVDYSIIEQVSESVYNVRVNMLYNVLSKPLLAQSYINNEENGIGEDSVGYDPIRVNWARFSGEFLNLGIQVWMNNNNAPHLINLVYDDTEGDIEVKGDTALLTLRHNAFDDAKNTLSNEQYASFPLSDLILPPATERPVKLTWRDYNGKMLSGTGIFALPSTTTAGELRLFFSAATLVD